MNLFPDTPASKIKWHDTKALFAARHFHLPFLRWAMGMTHPVFTSTPGVAEAVVRGHEKTFSTRDLSIRTSESNSISFCRTSRA